MSNNEMRYTRALHAILTGLLTVMAWLVVQLFGNLTETVANLDGRFVKYQDQATTQQRSADEALGIYMLEIERRLPRLEESTG